MLIRVFDFIVSLIVLSILFVPFVIIGLILKFTGEGKIFFMQERVGKGQKPIQIFKFATMLENSPNIGSGDITTGNDPRVLPVGKFLRKTKINELPQFLNSLFGSLSLVGPRPLTPKIFALFDEDYKRVLDHIPPGITGVASIVFRDEEAILSASSKDFLACYKEDIVPYKSALEQWYLANRSLWVNIILMVLTVWVIARPKSDIIFKIFPTLPRREIP